VGEMIDITFQELFTLCGSILTGIGVVSGFFFKKFAVVMSKIESMDFKLADIDKNLAVNTAFINEILKKERF
jgi:hypothetical protein